MKKIFFITCLAFLLVACDAFATPPTAVPTPSTSGTPSTGGTPPAGLEIILANSQHVVGPNRFAVGIVENGTSVQDAALHLKFFDLTSGNPVLKSEADAPFLGDNLGQAGVYVAHADFDKAGNWGVEATVNRSGRAPESKRLGFVVLADDPSPGIGDHAPLTKNPTLKDVNGDRTKISSATEDDSILHQISIADAVTNGKPTVILFATPRFCTSRTCGPSHQVVLSLARNYADRVNFIHVEVYKNFETFEPADAMREWNLQTEPWLFFVDKNGIIVDKYEGGITSREIVPAFLKFLQGQ